MTTLTTPGAALQARRLVNLDQVAVATASTVVDGAADGCRAVDLRVAGGVDLRVLPDRGLDLAAAWFAGLPLAWISAVGESAPLPLAREEDWLLAFGGGLVTTCGLRNVGRPSEGHGQHGAVSQQRAREVRTRRRIADDGQAELSITGTVDETAGLTGHLRLERRATTRTGSGLVELTDTVTNLGGGVEPAPFLYHVNLGAPLWDADASLSVTAGEVVPRDDDARAGLNSWSQPPRPDAAGAERVFEHRLEPDPDGRASATVTNPVVGLRLRLSWDAATLPRCHQWVHPALGVLGIEPANCSVLGRAADRAAGTLPVLEAGQTRTTGLRIVVEPVA
ncbi:MAG: DUF4432 family protein [Egibacteraceae bacterium]